MKNISDWINMFGLAIGVIGLLIALWQVKRARDIRKMYQELCQTRCKDLVETVGQLSVPIVQACDIKDKYLDKIMAGDHSVGEVVRPLRQLSDQIHSIHVSKNQLVRFCERLNDEHLNEFGDYIFDNVREKIDSYATSGFTFNIHMDTSRDETSQEMDHDDQLVKAP